MYILIIIGSRVGVRVVENTAAVALATAGNGPCEWLYLGYSYMTSCMQKGYLVLLLLYLLLDINTVCVQLVVVRFIIYNIQQSMLCLLPIE